jgi:hypothetical protein
LATALRRGEPLTDVRVLGPGLLAQAPSGTVAVVVRPGDPAAAALVRPGEQVDVLAGADPGVPGAPAPADLLVTRALVLAVTGDAAGGAEGGASGGPAGGGSTLLGGSDELPAGPPGVGGDGTLVVLALLPEQARRVAGAAGSDRSPWR